MNEILVIGLNHRFASLEVRERLAIGPERARSALAGLLARGTAAEMPIQEAVILSTCNRTELYLAGPEPAAIERTANEFLEAYGRFSKGQLAGLTYAYTGEATARHLLQVAAGLDSLVKGENEILGQVKDAYELAQEAKSTGPLLSGLFRAAIQTGKRVRAETELNRTGLSVATMVVELAGEMFGSLSDRKALLIGAGKISSLTARALVRAGLRCILVANRTYDRAEKLAESLSGRAVHFDALSECLEQVDLVICSTGAPHLVLQAGVVEAAQRRRQCKPLLVADLAVPRDADPAISCIPGVRLVDIDGLEELVITRHPLAREVRQAADGIVEEELAAFREWLSARRFAPLIQALQDRADSICQAQILRTLPQLGEVTPEQQQAIEVMARAIANKLLQPPISCLTQPMDEAERQDYARWVEILFGMS